MVSNFTPIKHKLFFYINQYTLLLQIIKTRTNYFNQIVYFLFEKKALIRLLTNYKNNLIFSVKIDIDECTVDPCQNSGNCTDKINDYDCKCKPGFQGKINSNL